MRVLTTFFIIILFGANATSQENLVPNPDFETYFCIPLYVDQADCLKTWFNPTSRTPDYMHRDGDRTGQQSADIPNNEWGYQEPHSGNAYVALHMYTYRDGRDEYLQVKLLDTLEVGQEYKVSVYVSMAEISLSACNGHGFLFSTYEETPYDGLEYLEPHLLYSNPIVIRDDMNWVKIEGTIIADHPYTYLTLGNFIVETDEFIREDFGDELWSSTYYFDDVSVIPTEKKIAIQAEIIDDCLPISVNFIAQNVDEGSSWEWSINGNKNNQAGKSLETTFDENGTYDITLITTENGKEYTVSKSITLDALQSPIADFDIQQEELGTNTPLEFENLSINGTSFFWDFGDGETSEEENPTHEYKENGDYTIRLTVSNESGCQDEVEQIFYIPCSGKITANTFTPNNDGSNDVFPFDSIAVCGGPFHIIIFNRWGGVVYESTNPTEPWSGGQVPDGTYFYKVVYREGEESGSILVIRGE